MEESTEVTASSPPKKRAANESPAKRSRDKVSDSPARQARDTLSSPLPRSSSVEKEPEGVIVKPPLKLPDPNKMILGFPPDLYRDCGTFYELPFPQRSPEWLRERKGRITGSNFGKVAGHGKYRTRREYLLEMAGITKPEEFKFFQLRAMEQGTRLEPYVRDWYEQEYQKKVIERGLVVPKWCMTIGVSVDGWIEHPNDGKVRPSGIIEIKCPQNMYPALVIHSQRIEKGEKFPEFYHDHIEAEHYDQMQGGMAVMEAEYCDYIVYCDKTKDMYPTRVMRNRKYWNEELFPAILSFIKERDELMAKTSTP